MPEDLKPKGPFFLWELLFQFEGVLQNTASRARFVYWLQNK